MSDDHYDLQAASTSRRKRHLVESRASSSNHDMADDRSYGSVFSDGSSRAAAVGQLAERLRVLEEEAEMLKAALFESVEERTELISEINEHFNTLHFELYGHGAQIISLLKDKRAGLLQILCQESNPSIVNKGLRAN